MGLDFTIHLLRLDFVHRTFLGALSENPLFLG